MDLLNNKGQVWLVDGRVFEGRILGSVEESHEGGFFLTYDFKRVGDDADGH